MASIDAGGEREGERAEAEAEANKQLTTYDSIVRIKNFRNRNF